MQSLKNKCFVKYPVHPRCELREGVGSAPNFTCPVSFLGNTSQGLTYVCGNIALTHISLSKLQQGGRGDAISPAIPRLRDEQPHLEIPSSHEPGSQSGSWSMLSCVVSMQLWFMSEGCILITDACLVLTASSHCCLSERWLLCYTAGNQENCGRM